MRPYLGALLFAFAVLAAACGGGGGSSALVPRSSAAPNDPHYGGASLKLKIPAQSHTGSARRAAYVSPNTQSVQIYAIPAGSASAMPSPAPQTFPVTTPSPCTQAADGSKACTFEVQAPLGEDIFVINTFGPNGSPLATFQTGAINVAIGSTPPPINITLTGIVSGVTVAMQSPEPSIAQSTQIWTVASPLPATTLSITPRDASGAAILTDTFDSPISVTLSPSNAGVSLSLTGSQCSPASSISGATVTITCAKDLARVTYAYDGTIARDTARNVVSKYMFSGSPQSVSGPQPQPAVLALTGTMLPVALGAPVINAFPFQFVPRGDGTFYYLAGSSPNSAFGSFDPSGAAPSQYATLPFVAAGIALSRTADVWIGVNNTGSGNSLQCFTSVSGTLANAISLPNSIAPFALTTDGNGNIWYYGMDANHTSWAGYFTPGAGCSTSGPMPNPVQFATISDYPQTMVADPTNASGVWLLSNSNASIYALSESSSGIIGSPTTTPPGSYFGQALAIDGMGNLYASLPPNATLAPILGELPSGGTTMNAANLEPGAGVGGLDVFPKTGSAAHLAYADTLGLATLDLLPNFGISNLQIVPVPRTTFYAGAFFDANGDPWMAYSDSTGAPNLAHVIRTSVWTIATTSISVPTTGGTIPIAISETGDSGPFTLTTSDPTVATAAAPWAGIDHLLPLQVFPGGSTVTVTVTDANKRSQTKTFSIAYVPLGSRRQSAFKIPMGLTARKGSW